MIPRRNLAFCVMLLLAGASRSQPPSDPHGVEKPDEGNLTGVTELQKLGAGIQRDETRPDRPVIGVSFGHKPLTDGGLKELKELKQLTRLDLGGTQVTDAGLKELKDLTQLTVLVLYGTKVTGTGLKELKDLKQLTNLHLRGAPVTDAGLKELKGLTHLTELYLGGTQVTDAGLKELKELKQLTTLDLEGTQVTDAGLKELKELKQLTRLDLHDTKVTDAGVKELQDALPECRVQRIGLREILAQSQGRPLKNDPPDQNPDPPVSIPQGVWIGIGGAGAAVFAIALVLGYFSQRRKLQGG